MAKTLSILEVSRKQHYIFQEKQLSRNVQRSLEIDYVTSDRFFRDAASDLYDTKRNLGYAGGGHTIVWFDSHSEAVRFNERITGKAQLLYPGMELFATVLDYDDQKTPGENLLALTQKLEAKKARRKDAFRYMGIGPELEEPAEVEASDQKPNLKESLHPPMGKSFSTNLDGLLLPNPKDSRDKGENFLAIVHIDGNAMGKRVQQVYNQESQDCEKLFEKLQIFSNGITCDYAQSFWEMSQVVAGKFAQKILPLRPVIMAGDDVCFVCRGDITLECSRIFLEKLAQKRNPQDGMPYTACAGIAIVHSKYPFFRAYTLAEALCSNAKKYGSQLDATGGVCAMDWHIEFGELKERLDILRQEYLDEDGVHLELRPMVVRSPAGIVVPSHRTYRSFCTCIGNLQRNLKQKDRMARGKLKGLRNVLKQGSVETAFYLTNRTLSDKLREAFQIPKYKTLELYLSEAGVTRCWIFDAIELIDHFQVLKEGYR